MPEVIMPKMGDAMEEGTLIKWIKGEGDEVEEGDPIAEIETDKVTLELEAEDSGTLSELYASEGQSIPVGDAIAVILGEGEEAPAREESGGGEAEAEAEEGGEEEAGAASTATGTETEAPSGEESSGEQPAASNGQAGGQANGQANGNFRASPIVRRLADENDLDLSKVEGSGPQGRIVERDVRSAMESGTAQRDGQDGGAEADGAQEEESSAPAGSQAQPQAAETFVPEPTREPGTEILEPSRMQQVIGQRMQQAKQEVPHFYATVEVQMDETMALRKQLNERLADQEIKLSVNDFVMKACAVGLGSHPKLNALYTSEGVELHESVQMAMAVALEGGLITPVIRDCAKKGLAAISSESKDMAKRAREGGLKPDEYQGGTFTVSNMGMFGVESFSAIINQPQAAIVAVSSIVQRPSYNEDGEIVPASMMKLTLSADHRIANGAEGALYMAEVKRLLENPMMLLV